MASGTITWSGIESREYKPKKDPTKTRTLWNAKDSGNRKFTIFDKNFATHIEQNMGKPMECEWEETQDGQYTNRVIQKIAGVEPTPRGGGFKIDEDRADRRAALQAAATIKSVSPDSNVYQLADGFVDWLRKDSKPPVQSKPAQNQAGPAPKPQAEPETEPKIAGKVAWEKDRPEWEALHADTQAALEDKFSGRQKVAIAWLTAFMSRNGMEAPPEPGYGWDELLEEL